MRTSLNAKVLFVFVTLVLLLSACIPSLHPIYTEATRMTDDRILGTWSTSGEGLTMSYDIQVTTSGDSSYLVSSESKETEDAAIERAIQDIFQGDEATWTFERASRVTFDKYVSETNSASITMSVGAPSFAPEGFELSSSEELPYYILTHEEIDGRDTTTTYLVVNMTEIGGDTYLDFIPFPKGDKRRQGTFGSNYITGHTFAKVDFTGDEFSIYMFDSSFIEDLIKSRKVRLRHEKIGMDESIVLTASTEELRAFIAKYGDDDRLFESAETFVQL